MSESRSSAFLAKYSFTCAGFHPAFRNIIWALYKSILASSPATPSVTASSNACAKYCSGDRPALFSCVIVPAGMFIVPQSGAPAPYVSIRIVPAIVKSPLRVSFEFLVNPGMYFHTLPHLSVYLWSSTFEVPPRSATVGAEKPLLSS